MIYTENQSGTLLNLLHCALYSPKTTAVNLQFVIIAAVAGIGHSMYFLSSLIITQFYFKKNRALASGISLCGHGVGTLVSMPLLRMCINSVGWRNAMMLHAGVLMQVVVLGALYRPVKTKNDTTHEETGATHEQTDARHEQTGATNEQNGTTHAQNDNNQEHDPDMNEVNLTVTSKHNADDQSDMKKSCLSTCTSLIKDIWDIKLFTNTVFLLFFISVLLALCSIELTYKLTAYKSTLDGISPTTASFLPAIAGGASTCSRLIMSFVANLKFVNRTVLLACAMLVHSTGCLLIPFATTFETYAGCVALFGSGLGKFLITCNIFFLKKKNYKICICVAL